MSFLSPTFCRSVLEEVLLLTVLLSMQFSGNRADNFHYSESGGKNSPPGEIRAALKKVFCSAACNLSCVNLS